MRTDIAVVGCGLAGAIAAVMLGRAGHDLVVVDPNEVYPPDFRCEKLEQDHIRVLQRTGLASVVTQAATSLDTLWIARFGRLVDKMPLRQYAMPYDALVNAMRSQIPPQVRTCRSWARMIQTGPERQQIQLSDGGGVDARLVILASGLNWSLREALGVNRELISPCHSVTVGFDLHRSDGRDFAFPALQYNPERVGNGVAYLTLFRMGGRMRANLFLYLPLKSPTIAAFRSDPDVALRTLLPKLSRLIGDYRIGGPVKVRPTDLHVFRNVEQPGVVMIGDAFTTPCPATGTGTMKVFNDVERLCRHHLPRWLSTPGMGTDKIRSFYLDPSKVDVDASSAAKAYSVRAMSTERGLQWTFRRLLRFSIRLVKWSARSMAGRQPRYRIPTAPAPNGQFAG